MAGEEVGCASKSWKTGSRSSKGRLAAAEKDEPAYAAGEQFNRHLGFGLRNEFWNNIRDNFKGAIQ